MLWATTVRAFTFLGLMNTGSTSHKTLFALSRLHGYNLHDKSLTVKGIIVPQRDFEPLNKKPPLTRGFVCDELCLFS